ncbi:NAD(P)/FAD-dependent oxidoreductase [Flagellimonas zhangzhouensis]|uniref:D-amino-acid dehydrogenase n=1 Tax=Flagellimonas zhangzhouensis TaxID=1073328 RepID=A0A1H2SVJ7_9FLAO|nr:FAD-dependent oxidoreductase [Allomuricauda zhangzhouensis]SDQ80133.1 D-amino-acid dehydrogenase [Allomuricauda zhangzhouensis]SDW35693.1 D-amino-acid dehydrogenase [Allomuricauda zhangzhouensis]
MGKNKSVIVVGGGIVGLSTAYFLQKEGHEVTVLDKSDITSGASFVNAGYLTPSHIISLASPGMITQGLKYMFNSASPFYMKPRLDPEFIKWAWNFKKSSTKEKVAIAMPIIRDINLLSRSLYEDMQKSGDLGDFEIGDKGLLMMYQTDAARDHEIEVIEKAAPLGLEGKVLSLEELKKLEPNVELNAKGAILWECDRHTTPPLIMKRLLEHLEKSGVTIKKNEAVLDVSTSNGKITEVKTEKSCYKADEVVFAAGSWTTGIAKKLGVKVPLQAGKGYRINMEAPTHITMPAILMEKKIAVTPMEGFTRFAGTMEFSGINHTIRKERVEAIAAGVEAYYTGLKIPEADKSNAKCGLRPVSPDGLPYIGRAKAFSNLTIATGHAMMGWSLGPATGKMVTEIISGKKLSMDISPFHPQRRF